MVVIHDKIAQCKKAILLARICFHHRRTRIMQNLDSQDDGAMHAVMQRTWWPNPRYFAGHLSCDELRRAVTQDLST